MKHKLIAIFLLVALLISPLAYSSDFVKGLKAYNKGDYQQAYGIFRSLAEDGDSSAQFNLGLMYYEGQGIPQNDVEAIRWYRAAAEQGHAKAQFNLGNRYAHGRGVAQNYVEAVRWFRDAAEQGYANAQYNLGVMYAQGQGVPQDYVRSHMWINLAASQGDQDAAKARDALAKIMTPAQIQEAQRLAQEWVNSR